MRSTIGRVATIAAGVLLVWLDIVLTAPFQDDAVHAAGAAAEYGYWWLPAAVQLLFFIAPIAAIAVLVVSALEED